MPRPPSTHIPCTSCGQTSSRGLRRGMCGACYERDLRRRKREVAPRCRVCDVEIGRANRSGLCERHARLERRRLRRRAAGIPARQVGRPECVLDGCKRPNVARGLCNTHYVADRRRRLNPTHIRRSAPAPERPTYGIWTITPRTTTVHWKPRTAGPDWVCPVCKETPA